jgi:hypothetical protein
MAARLECGSARLSFDPQLFYSPTSELPEQTFLIWRGPTIFIDFNWVSDYSWETLLRALSARRTQLQKVHVYVSRYPHVVIPEA